jgi:hypothetical protein
LSGTHYGNVYTLAPVRLRVSTVKLWKVHIAPFVDRGSAVRAVGRKRMAQIGESCLSPLPLNQVREPLTPIPPASGAAYLKKMDGGFEVTERA